MNSTEAIGFLIWIAIIYFIITHFSFFKDNYLTNKKIIFFFTFKFIFGCAYSYIIFYSYMAGDSLGYFNQGLYFYNIIENQGWREFASILLQPNTGSYPEAQLSKYYANAIYWTNNGSCLMARFNAVFHIISGHFYLTHTLLYSFISFIGLIGIYKTTTHYFRDKKAWIAGSIMLFPSIAFWGSGIHKEAFMHLSFGLILYYTLCYKSTNKLQYIIYIFIFSVLAFYVRNYAFALFFPPYLAYLICQKYYNNINAKPKTTFIFIAVYSAFLILTWLYNQYFTNRGLVYKIVKTQNEFISNGGNSVIVQKSMDPTIDGIFRFFLSALSNGFFRPFPTDTYKVFILFTSLELWLFWLLFISTLFFFCDYKKFLHPLILFFFCFSLTYMLMLGYLVNTFGAIVRYKTTILPMLLVVWVILVDRNKIKNTITYINKLIYK